jgi:hypothetical protein
MESTKGILKGSTITIKRDGRLRWANWNTVGYGAKPAIGNHSASQVNRRHLTASDTVYGHIIYILALHPFGKSSLGCIGVDDRKGLSPKAI